MEQHRSQFASTKYVLLHLAYSIHVAYNSIYETQVDPDLLQASGSNQRGTCLSSRRFLASASAASRRPRNFVFSAGQVADLLTSAGSAMAAAVFATADVRLTLGTS